MKLGSRFVLVCCADGERLPEVFVSLTLKVRRKNDFHVWGGPTDETGTAVVTREDIESSVNRDRDMFIMDYTGLADCTGEVIARPCNREAIERALCAYEMFSPHLPYPEGYREQLQDARHTLERVAPATLSVTVQHDGVGITVATESVSA
jgi:hypothetical protein